MASEIDKLLSELRGMKDIEINKPQNTRETWKCIGNGDWKKAGFNNEEEMKQFCIDNPYSNL